MMKTRSTSELVNDEELVMLIEGAAPKGRTGRWLSLRWEVEELAAAQKPGHRDRWRESAARADRSRV
jgi:hypothetical protein